MRKAFKHLLGALLWSVLRLRRLLCYRRASGEPQKIVLIADIGLGNAVMALPLLRSLRLNRPKVHITLLTTPGAAAMFRMAPLADRIIALQGNGWQRIRQAAALRKEDFDLCLVTFPTLLLSTELLPLWLGARGNVIHDYRPIQPYFHYLLALYEPPVVLDQSLHDVEQNLALLPPGWRSSSAYPAINITAQARDAAAAWLSEHGVPPEASFFAMHPGGKRGADYKRWPVANFRELAEELLRRYGLRTVAILGPDEADLAAELAAPSLIPLMTSDLEIIIAVLEKSRYFISNDSGIMHLASLLGRPQLALWGATDPRRNRSWNEQAVNLINESAGCRPCIRFVPTGAHQRCRLECISGITVQAVMTQLAAHIAGGSEAFPHPLQ